MVIILQIVEINIRLHGVQTSKNMAIKFLVKIGLTYITHICNIHYAFYQRHKCVLYSTYIRDITAHILTTVFRTSKNPREDIYDLLNTCDKLDFFYSFHELFVNQLRAV